MSSISDLGRAYLLGPSAAPEYEPNKTDGVVAFDEIERRVGGAEAEIDEVRNLASTTLQWKEPVVVMATGNVAIASGLVNGATLNGVTLATGNRVLLRAQTAPAENGVYVVVASGAASRAADCDTAAELLGAAVYVTGGTTGAGRQYVQATPAPITLGSTGLVWRILSDQGALNATLASHTTTLSSHTTTLSSHTTSITALEAWMGGGKNIVTAQSAPIAYDPFTRTLHVPTIYGNRGSGGWVLAAPTGHTARRLTESGSVVQLVYIDLDDLTANGSSSATALKITTSYPSSLAQGSAAICILGSIYSRRFISAEGVLVAPLVPNQCGISRDDNDSADLLYSLTEPVPLTQAGSLAAGFTRGWTGTNPTGFYFGSRFPEPMRRGVVFFRFWVESDVADAFGTVRGYLISPAVYSGNLIISVPLERTIDAHTRVYSGYYQLAEVAGKEYIGMWCGSSVVDGTVRAFGLQYAVLPSLSDGFVSEGDRPRLAGMTGYRLRALEAANIAGLDLDGALMPPSLKMVEGRGYPLFVDQFFDHKPGPYSVSVASKRSDHARPLDMRVEGPTLDLPPERLGPVTRFIVHDKTTFKTSGWVLDVPTTVVTAASVAGRAPRVNMLGDSLTVWVGSGPQTWRRLRQMTGVDPDFFGTIELEDSQSVPADTLTVPGEGRGGREYADYIYEHTDSLAPVAAGSESAYLALDRAGRTGYNPYIRTSTPTDDPAKVFNGHIFDYGFYLSRFGYAPPTHFVLNLGTNDITQQDDAESLAQIIRGLSIIIPSVLAAAPSCKVLVVCNSFGSQVSASRWNGEHRAAIRATIDWVRDLADARVSVVPMWCTVSRENGFILAAGSADAETGVAPVSVYDPYHYGMYGAAQYGDVLAQWILAA